MLWVISRHLRTLIHGYLSLCGRIERNHYLANVNKKASHGRCADPWPSPFPQCACHVCHILSKIVYDIKNISCNCRLGYNFSIRSEGWKGLFLKRSVFLTAFFWICLGRPLNSLSKVAVVEISIYWLSISSERDFLLVTRPFLWSSSERSRYLRNSLR